MAVQLYYYYYYYYYINHFLQVTVSDKVDVIMDDENTSPTDVLYLRLLTGEFDARFCVTIIIHNYN